MALGATPHNCAIRRLVPIVCREESIMAFSPITGGHDDGEAAYATRQFAARKRLNNSRLEQFAKEFIR
jgi:hypothetical protein